MTMYCIWVFSLLLEEIRNKCLGLSKIRCGKDLITEIHVGSPKQVGQAFPTVVMFVLLLPLGVCQDIEKLLNSFRWGSKRNGGRGISWLHWDHLCIHPYGVW